MEYIDLLILNKKRQEKYFMNPHKYARKIKRKAGEILGDVKVYLFGSVVNNKWLPTSDIDILVVSSEKITSATAASEIEVALLKSVDFYSPFEIHLVTPEVCENWYKKFLKCELVEVE